MQSDYFYAMFTQTKIVNQKIRKTKFTVGKYIIYFLATNDYYFSHDKINK